MLYINSLACTWQSSTTHCTASWKTAPWNIHKDKIVFGTRTGRDELSHERERIAAGNRIFRRRLSRRLPARPHVYDGLQERGIHWAEAAARHGLSYISLQAETV